MRVMRAQRLIEQRLRISDKPREHDSERMVIVQSGVDGRTSGN